MRIAIPTADGLLCTHFGHCQLFTVLEIDPETKKIIRSERLSPPPHEPGVFPSWLSSIGCDIIIAGGMGGRAIEMFRQNNIQVVIGAPNRKPDEIALAYLNGELMTGSNPCDDASFHGKKQCGN
jgi:predicted Fe-Mo cluster-binding NifX family protein